VRSEGTNGTYEYNTKLQEAVGASCFVLFPMYDLDERGEASSKHEKEISSEYQNLSAIQKIKYLDTLCWHS